MADQATQSTPGQGATDLDGIARRTRAGLAYACTHLDELRGDLRDIQASATAGEPPLLQDLTDAVSAGRPCAAALDAIHAVLLDAGDQLGLYGRVEPGQRGLNLTGVTAAPPASDERLYLCPVNQCSRYSWPAPGPAPSCAITGEGLREGHL